MTAAVPTLEAKKPSLMVRLAAAVSSGVGQVIDTIEPYTAYWNERNAVDVVADGPLLVAVGDSTSIGIGASHPSLSFIGQLADALGRRDGRRWRVVNLAQSGAKLDDGLNRQIPALADLPEPDLVISCLGTNDLTWGLDVPGIRRRMIDLVEALPNQAIWCPAAAGSPRARLVNRAAMAAADERGLTAVNPWGRPGPRQRLAADRFHPNDIGYALMCQPLAQHLGAPEPDLDALRPARRLGPGDDDR